MISNELPRETVFCFQNCSNLLKEKKILVIKKNFINFRLQAQNLQKFWDCAIEQFIRTVKGQYNFFKGCLFNLFLDVFQI